MYKNLVILKNWELQKISKKRLQLFQILVQKVIQTWLYMQFSVTCNDRCRISIQHKINFNTLYHQKMSVFWFFVNVRPTMWLDFLNWPKTVSHFSYGNLRREIVSITKDVRIFKRVLLDNSVFFLLLPFWRHFHSTAKR